MTERFGSYGPAFVGDRCVEVLCLMLMFLGGFFRIIKIFMYIYFTVSAYTVHSVFLAQLLIQLIVFTYPKNPALK